MAYLARIDLYPIKSLDGISVPMATVLPQGALAGDRAFALMDQQGRFVNGKRTPRIHGVRSRFTPDLKQVTVGVEPDLEPAPEAMATLQEQTFPLAVGNRGLADWFETYFQQPITLAHNGEQGFPDDTASPGPTVISTATLTTVAGWFGLSVAAIRCRFRTNLEIDGVPPFWEDGLFSEPGSLVPFHIGAVQLWGVNPCQRCVVPTRDPLTGAVSPEFARRFAERRQETLGPGVARSPFNHFYRLAVNTRLPETEGGKVLRVGDAVSILGD